MPKITVGILTFNRCEAVQKAIESVYDQSFSDVEIVVVDSASEDGTPEVVRERFPGVRYIRLPRNLGCPGGRNHIYANCTGEYIVNLDDDGWLGEGALERIAEVLDAHPDVGILALRQLYSDEPAPEGACQPRSSYEETGLFRGGLSVFRRSMLDVIGLYPEEFFLYAEESHLSIRAMNAGYKILDTPDIIMWHPRLGGSGQHGSKWNYYKARNEMLVVVDLYPFPLVLTHLALRALAHGRWALVHWTLWSYIRALAHVIVRLPARMRSRTPASRDVVIRFLRSLPRG
jgi:GT2 family glycosyltransferase